jgi:hypothetical protein
VPPRRGRASAASRRARRGPGDNCRGRPARAPPRWPPARPRARRACRGRLRGSGPPPARGRCGAAHRRARRSGSSRFGGRSVPRREPPRWRPAGGRVRRVAKPGPARSGPGLQRSTCGPTATGPDPPAGRGRQPRQRVWAPRLVQQHQGLCKNIRVTRGKSKAPADKYFLARLRKTRLAPENLRSTAKPSESPAFVGQQLSLAGQQRPLLGSTAYDYESRFISDTLLRRRC